MLHARHTVPLLIALVAGLAPDSHAANQLYEGSLVIESFGNDVAGPATPFSVFGMPQGIQCNPGHPRCPLASTPAATTMGGMKAFDPLGNLCVPITYFGVATRPAKGATATTGQAKNVHYRNPAFFTSGGAPNATSCSGTTTVSGASATMFLTTHSPKRGAVMKGAPLTGQQIVALSGTGPAGFKLDAAPMLPAKPSGPTGFGLRRTTSGAFNFRFPYVYRYTYATLRNSTGTFSAGGGPGAFELKYRRGQATVARIAVKAGANKFGGVMNLLGQLTTKACYYRNGGCSLGGHNWRFDAVGATAYTNAGMVTGGYLALYTAKHYHTALMQDTTVMARGYRFPWTTGSVTVSAPGVPHTTIERRKGYDHRTPLGKGTIQLVTPVLTRWTQPAADRFTGGIGVLRLRFVPEPEKWLLLVAALSLLGVLHRYRER